jgi:thiol-disulfide isomerase/thioredoxin
MKHHTTTQHPLRNAALAAMAAAAIAVPGAQLAHASPGGGVAPSSTDAPPLIDQGPAPDLVDIDGWLQSDVTTIDELQGRVVAVQFWTFSCDNWLATLPHLQQLYADHHDAGLEVIGIHSPEFDFEADADNIVDAAARLDVTWPIVLDTDKRTFHAWQDGPTAYWPRIYLIDRAGHIRYDHIGEGRYDEIDAAVRALLAEPS